MRLNQAWIATKRGHDRFSRSMWQAGWVIPLTLLGLATSLQFWRSLSYDTGQAIMLQVDYEDGALCTRFGFTSGTEEHANCKAALLELRRSDEKLIATTSIP